MTIEAQIVPSIQGANLTPWLAYARLWQGSEIRPIFALKTRGGFGNVVQPALTIGACLANRYRVDYLIASGGYASVYRVTDLEVALALAAKEITDPDPWIREQFALEAQLLMSSHHPNIPRGYAHFEENGRAYLIMDFVEGQDLEQILSASLAQRGRPIEEAQALHWLVPICDALQEMHTQVVPVIHRDIKPANIKLSATGMPILIDFGLAKLGLTRATNQAAQGVTPGYAPPEQYLAQGKTDPRSDIYSMGATLYTLLTGREPPEAPNRLLSKSGHTGEPMVPARLLNPSISSNTAHIIDKAMAISSNDRHQSAQELQQEITASLLALEYGRMPVRMGTQTGPLPFTVPAEPEDMTQHRTAVRRKLDLPMVPTRILPPATGRVSQSTTRVLPSPTWFDLGGPLIKRMGKAGLVFSAIELYWGLLCTAALGGAIGTGLFTHTPSVLVAVAGVLWLGVVIALTALVVRAVDRPIARRGKISNGQRGVQGVLLVLLWLAMNVAAFFSLGGVSPVAGLFGLGFLGLASILTGLLSVANVLA